MGRSILPTMHVQHWTPAAGSRAVVQPGRCSWKTVLRYLFLKAMADEEEQLRDQGAEDEEWVGCDGCGKWRKVPARVPVRPRVLMTMTQLVC